MKKTYIAPQTLEVKVATTSLMTVSNYIPMAQNPSTSQQETTQEAGITDADSRIDRRSIWDDDDE